MSEKMARIYKGYRLNSKMRIEPLKDTPVIDLEHLLNVFKSKDENEWKKMKWAFDGTLRFLNGKKIESNKIALGSFPRSGNTFMRKYFDLLTGIHSGADNTMHINVMLQMIGMAGEDTVDDKCWIIKTHSPWCMPEAPIFSFNKLIVIVRNPLDTFVSWLELCHHCNHAQKCEFELEKDYPKFFDWYISEVGDEYRRFYDYHLDLAKQRRIPILFLRFEDMLMDPEPQLRDIMRFLLGIDDLTGTNAERRVKEVINLGHQATQTYKLKQSTLRFNSQGKRYSQEQIDRVGELLAEYNNTFGYAQYESEDSNPTGFFKYPENHAQRVRFNKFKEFNEQNI